MTVHLVKICVGATGIDSLSEWQAGQVRRGATYPFHVTRMFPRREAEILDGGSLYWTISNRFALRQRIVGLERVTGADGIGRCRIDFDPELVTVEPLARRPFQGWRYLDLADAPQDVSASSSSADTLLHRQLAELGLL